MQVSQPVGRDAATKKYDILSALMAHGLAQDKHRQRLVMRLLSLITTRYNWTRNELSMGQKEIARLWCVDERTVKREMAKLRAMEWLQIKRAGARGRVSLYGLDLVRILLDTRPQWENIGPDFIERMEMTHRAAPAEPGNVVPFKPVATPVGEGLWAETQRQLHAEDSATFGAWFQGLIEAEREGGTVQLAAPSRFHATYVSTHLQARLLTALRRADSSVSDVCITG
jgi:DnaA-like protein